MVSREGMAGMGGVVGKGKGAGQGDGAYKAGVAGKTRMDDKWDGKERRNSRSPSKPNPNCLLDS